MPARLSPHNTRPVLPPRRDLLFVGVQALLFVALAFDPTGVELNVHRILRLLGWAVCAASVAFGLLALVQLGSNLTPWPSPKHGSKLVTSGTYAIARHPIYASLIVFAIGLALATGSPWRLVVGLLLWAWFRRKAAYEEGLLRERFEGYAQYADRTRRFGW